MTCSRRGATGGCPPFLSIISYHNLSTLRTSVASSANAVAIANWVMGSGERGGKERSYNLSCTITNIVAQKLLRRPAAGPRTSLGEQVSKQNTSNLVNRMNKARRDIRNLWQSVFLK